MKKIFSSHDKAKIALAALKETDTLASIAAQHGAHPIQVGLWKKAAKENLHTLFDTTHSESKIIAALKEERDELHRLVGVREAELVWLQKKSAP